MVTERKASRCTRATHATDTADLKEEGERDLIWAWLALDMHIWRAWRLRPLALCERDRRADPSPPDAYTAERRATIHM